MPKLRNSIYKQESKLSVKAAQIDEEKSLIAKFGEGATKSGATLKGIFEKAIGKKGKKKNNCHVRSYRTAQKNPQINQSEIEKLLDIFQKVFLILLKIKIMWK